MLVIMPMPSPWLFQCYIKYNALKTIFLDKRKKYEFNFGLSHAILDKNDYYLKFENKFEDYFKKGYDIFLKNNNQKAGLKTYSLVIDLLINDYQSKI